VSDEKKKGERYEVKVGPETRKKIDKLVNEAAGPKRAIVAALDRRYTGKPGSYAPYERFLCSDGFTVFVSLDTFKVSLSSKPDRHAEAKIERRAKKAAARATAKAAEAKPAAVKVKATTKKMPVVKFDKDLPTLEGTANRQVKK
jgi:hypothetical protein